MFAKPPFIGYKRSSGGGGSSEPHDEYAPGEIHTPFNWVVADEAARNAIVPAASDVHKALWQIDTGIIYILTDDSPVTWTAIAGGGGGAAGAVTTVYRTTDFGVAASTLTPVQWSASRDLVSGSWVIGTPTRLTVPAGYTKAKIDGFCIWDHTNNVGSRIIEVTKNNSKIVGGGVGLEGTNFGYFAMSFVSSWLDVVAGDYFEVKVYQNSGAVVDIIGPHATYDPSSVSIEFK